jgi:hypothetical protein
MSTLNLPTTIPASDVDNIINAEFKDLTRAMYGKIVDGKIERATFEETKTYWGNNNSRNVGRDEINGITVSTVFLVINHGFGFDNPKWFETMIFGGKRDQDQERYETLEQAKLGHQRWCKLVQDDQRWYVRLWNWLQTKTKRGTHSTERK